MVVCHIGGYGMMGIIVLVARGVRDDKSIL